MKCPNCNSLYVYKVTKNTSREILKKLNIDKSRFPFSWICNSCETVFDERTAPNPNNKTSYHDNPYTIDDDYSKTDVYE